MIFAIIKDQTKRDLKIFNIACLLNYKPHFLDLLEIHLGWIYRVLPTSSLKSVVLWASLPQLTILFNFRGVRDLFHYKADHSNLKTCNSTWFLSLSREFLFTFYLFFHLLLLLFLAFLVYLLHPLLWSEFIIYILADSLRIVTLTIFST